jgi:fucose 4-O-acetylase-like acetyltransferase
MVENAAVKERRNDLDWVRVLAVLLLVPFHAARIFDIFETFYVKNDTLSPWLSHIVVFFLNKWHMPLLFLLAGASSWYALRFRSGARYLGERLKRLPVPFVFGTLVLYDLIVRRTNVTRFLFGMKRIGAFHTERRR